MHVTVKKKPWITLKNTLFVLVELNVSDKSHSNPESKLLKLYLKIFLLEIRTHIRATIH